MDEQTTRLDTVFTNWRKSSHSQPTPNGDCLEVGRSGASIGVRDTKRPDGCVLVFSRNSWRAFLDDQSARR
ncbi:DUF397 domain-containing protein [Saccharothrix sp.]|uniref:DUF397 domain-containing protein n=1 Tax=Saccharothrix sp. TaxID=1873460 RepID=UPI00281110F5|nr:DUF397 domain-containing protein [Saccharothrix sp.]